MSVFIDTSAWYALLVGSENAHTQVRQAFQQLAESGQTLITTSYVVVETTALLQHRIGLTPVRDLVEHILPLADLVYVDRELHTRAVQRLIRTDRRRLSLVDCVSLECMRQNGIRTVLALDPHLAEDGAEQLPG